MTHSAATPQRRLAVIDIGSNSVRFVIYELFGSNFTPVYNEKVLAGLGRMLRLTGKLDPHGVTLARQALLRFRTLCDVHELETVLIGATAAMREAEDAPAFILDIFEQTGFQIKPLSGVEEAQVAAMGLLAAEPRAHGIAADLGGASLELVSVKAKNISDGISFPIGPFQLLGKDLTQDRAYDLAKLRPIIREHLQAAPKTLGANDNLYLIGGAWRNLFSVHQRRHNYPMRTLQSYRLPIGGAKDLARWAYGDGRHELLTWPGINNRRAETLPFSGLILDELLNVYTPKRVVISTAGLREGLIYQSLSPELRARDSLFDGCRDLARGNLQNQFFAAPLYSFLEAAEDAFPQVMTHDNEIRLRRAACYLAGMGKGFHPDYKAALVFETVLYAPLAGLTHKERAYLALMLFASLTGKERMPNRTAISLLLSDDEQRAARIYGTAIRLAVVASGNSEQLLGELKLAHSGPNLSLSATPKFKSLMSERVSIRFNQLCQIAGLTPVFNR
jgi:exopolyphosphatase/guanosine-5'-triphosphate,3'-diphosphate pyrophosphatase